MPWTVADVDGFKKDLTAKQKKVWVAIANAALERCQEENGRDCEKQAIIRANGAVEESMGEIRDRIKEALKDLWPVPQEQSLEDAAESLEKALADIEPEPVEAAQEVELFGDIMALSEKAVAPDGSLTVKIIKPGWGSSGYYPPEVLERDGPKVFPAGTKMYWDHATASEEREKPEGALDRLVGKTLTDAAWRPNGAAGAGLYADALAYEGWAAKVNELAPDIGVSLRAMGRAKKGEAEGKKGPIITELVAAKSVDYVTTAGAGGKVLQLFESARTMIQEDTVDEKQAKELQEANDALTAENARLQVSLVASEAQMFVSKALAMHKIPEPTYEKLAASLIASPVIVDGKLDEGAYKVAIDEAVKAELAYLASVGVTKSGTKQIRGMGESTPHANAEEAKIAVKESYKRTFMQMGKTVVEAEALADIAATGR